MKQNPNQDTLNVLGEPLIPCCFAPKTGYYRDGYCHTGPRDIGNHVVCAELTEDFLAFTKAQGNDLSTPRPEWGFPGLKPGDCWCLCANRWVKAYNAGVAPPVILAACHRNSLMVIPFDILKEYSR